jgi:ABC-type lipoprotein export system ATPase subunit
MTAVPLVRAEGVSRTYGSGTAATVALSAATCRVMPGDRIGVTGPSGSGKSTLLGLLAGLDEPTTGTVDWPGLGTREQLRPRLVGVVFQDPSLLPPLDVVENVALPLLLADFGERGARAAALRALDLLGLADLAGNLPEELSGGQAQRVAVARVLAVAPRLILADEPTGQLDHVTGAQVVDALLAAAAHAGAAFVLTTHDPDVADRLPQRWQVTDGRLHIAALHPLEGQEIP